MKKNSRRSTMRVRQLERHERQHEESLSPPAYNPDIVVGRRLRFTATDAGTSITITQAQLMNLLCVGVDATHAYRLAAAVRLSHVEVWGPMGSTLAPVTVGVEFTASNTAFGAQKKAVRDTSMGSNRCAYVCARPRPNSASGMWFTSAGTDNVFSLWFPAGAIIDVHLSISFRAAEAASAVSDSPTAATAGTVYCAPLDGVSNGNLVPDGYNVLS
jgi:hypothetical protein